MGDEARTGPPSPWIVMVPFPALGHITPMLHFARALHTHLSIHSIIAIPSFINRRLFRDTTARQEDCTVVFSTIEDGIVQDSPDFSAIEFAMENHMPANLELLLKTRLAAGAIIVCVVVDLLASWAIQVGRRCELPVVGFWPAMLETYKIVWAIPEMIQSGLISETAGIPTRQATLEDNCASGLSPYLKLTTQDLPWLVGTKVSQSERFKFWLQVIHRSTSISCLFVNSFFRDDDGVKSEEHQILNIGALVMANANIHLNSKGILRFWDEEDAGCLEWLALQKPFSVIYVCFGSWVGPILKEKIVELASGLEATGRPFLWVLPRSWWNGVDDAVDGYFERIGKRGKIVSWAPQMKVLQHEAVGCHLTHCGWNSILESILHGKCLICYPISGDQFVNCAYTVSVWKIGIKLDAMERSAVEECVRVLMDDGEEERRRMCELKATILEDGGGVERAVRILHSFLVRDLKNK